MTEKKHGLFESLKDLVSSEVPDRSAAPRNTPLPAAPSPANGQLTGSSGVGADPAALQKLEAQMQAAMPPLYTGFMEQYQALAEDIPDEKTRFKVTLKTTKTTPDQILASLDEIVHALDGANGKFAKSFESKMEEHKALEQSIGAKKQQLHDLQEEINGLETRSREEASKLDAVKRGFEAAFNLVVGRLDAQKKRISEMKG